MDIEVIKRILLDNIELKELIISLDHGHYNINAIGNVFTDLSKIQRHKLIYQPLMPYILNKQIHAVEIKTYTTSEWEHIVRH